MRQKLIPDEEILALSRKIMQDFYNRQIDEALTYLSEDFMWIGAFAFQYVTSKESFINVTQSEINSIPFTMFNEEFFVLSKSTSSYAVCAKFALVAHAEGNTVLTTHTRVTMLWKYVKDELKLIHVHGSNAQDVPLTTSLQSGSASSNDIFLNYLTSINTLNDSNKISFKDTVGAYHYFSEHQIIFLEANLQNTYLHTNDNCIQISGLLSENAKKLSKHFYRIHKSYIVNTTFVHSLARYTVSLLGNKQIPISKEKYMDFRKFLKSTNSPSV